MMSSPQHARRRSASRPRGLLLAFAAMAALATPRTVSALPLFSRTESAPCARCHLAAPVLNAAGERFMANGYRVPGVAAHGADGAQPLPVSVVFEAGALYARADTVGSGGQSGPHTAGEFRQHVLDLHAAGTAGGNVSFHIQASLDSAASAVHTTTAFVQFDDVVRGGALAIKAGTFDAGLPFLSAARRPTRREYLTPVQLAAQGVELNGAHAAWGYALGQMNSSRVGVGSNGRGFNRLEDTYLRVTRALGEQAVGGRLVFDRQDSNISFHAWLQRLRAQFGGRFGAGRLWIVPAWTLDRYDDRPAAGMHQRHTYLLLEGTGLLGAQRDWALVARLEHEHTTAVGLAPGGDQDLEALRLARVVTPNARVALEWSRVAVTAGLPRESRVDAIVQLAY
jgi:hypothetical protein